MEKAKLIEMIKNNPNAIAYITNPTDELKLLAVQKNGSRRGKLNYRLSNVLAPSIY